MRTLRKGAATITLRNKGATLIAASLERDDIRIILRNIAMDTLRKLRAQNPKVQGWPIYCTQANDVIHFFPAADKQYPVELHLMLRVVE